MANQLLPFVLFAISGLFHSSVFAQGPGPCSQLPFPPSQGDIDNFLGTTFDYIVIGGGTAGVTLATRLAEDGTHTVGVIEAGPHHREDDLVDIPQIWGQAWNREEYDWSFQMVPQRHAANRSVSMPRGRMLGGSSGINGMAWNRATEEEYNSWEVFGPENGWNWDGLLPFMIKSENMSRVTPDPFPGLTDEQRNLTSPVYGFNGPMEASHQIWYADPMVPYVQALNSIGIDTVAEPQAGNPFGVYNTWSAIRRPDSTRTYSAKQYYCNGVAGDNLHILVGATGHRLHFGSSDESGNLVASGVEFSVGSTTYAVNATKEIILSSGPIKSPQLLELSGVGDPAVLSQFNIETIVELPGVGANLQEHVWSGVQWELKDGITTFDILRNNQTFAEQAMAEYRANGTGPYAVTDAALTFFWEHDWTSSERWEELLKLYDEGAALAPKDSVHEVQMKVQRKWLTDGKVPSQEVIQLNTGSIEPEEGKSYCFVLGGNIHPISRGSVHISSADPAANLLIDPAFLATEFDRQMALETIKFIRMIGATAPFSDLIRVQTNPAPDASDADIMDWIANTAASGGHYIGTNALAPREKKGVVDTYLKVYGLANVRVVDASIFPLPIGHTQSTVYAIAEKAADFILKGN